MSFLFAMPHRIQMNAESGFRSSVIHAPASIISEINPRLSV
jgi:hypothetical protein